MLGSKQHILVVDDEASALDVVSRMLQSLDYRVTTAPGGPEAIAKVLELQAADDLPDLLMTDIVMPQIDGVALVQQLVDRGIELPTVAITGYGDKAMVADLLRQGFLEYLDKPFTLEQLQQILTAAFQKVERVRAREQERLAHSQQQALLEGLEDLVRQVDDLVRETDAKESPLAEFDFAAVVRKLREASGLVRVQYAAAVGIPPVHLAALETDPSSIPTVRDIGRLARYHGVSVVCLVLMATGVGLDRDPDEVESALQKMRKSLS